MERGEEVFRSIKPFAILSRWGEREMLRELFRQVEKHHGGSYQGEGKDLQETVDFFCFGIEVEEGYYYFWDGRRLEADFRSELPEGIVTYTLEEYLFCSQLEEVLKEEE